MMAGRGDVRRRHVERVAPYLVSLLVHAILLALIALTAKLSPDAPSPGETLSVEIVSAQQFQEAAPIAPKDWSPTRPMETVPTPPPAPPGAERGEADACASSGDRARACTLGDPAEMALRPKDPVSGRAVRSAQQAGEG